MLIEALQFGVSRIVVPTSVHQNIALLGGSNQIITVLTDLAIGRVDETEGVPVHRLHGSGRGGNPVSQAKVRRRKCVITDVLVLGDEEYIRKCRRYTLEDVGIQGATGLAVGIYVEQCSAPVLFGPRDFLR